jgi:spore photoproduct lyase
MEDYREKFNKHINNSNFTKLEKNLQEFIAKKAFLYKFSFSDIKQLVDMSIDIKDVWTDEQSRKNTLLHVKKYYDDLKAKPKKYGEFKSTHKDNKFNFTTFEKEELSLGMCPVASPKTRCCNLMTLDAVESCGFDCSYCSIQSFYNENKIGFDKNFATKLKNLKLDPKKTYHIGTGQSSDSLMW